MDDRGKALETQRTLAPNTICFRFHKVGHFASQCPARSLHIGELEEEDLETTNDCEKDIYEAELNLIDEYDKDEETIEATDLLGVVRCILSQTRTQED